MRRACPRHHRHHSDNSQFLQQQEEMKKKGIEEALDKAKETLSNMMHETETELDEAIMSCKESSLPKFSSALERSETKRKRDQTPSRVGFGIYHLA